MLKSKLKLSSALLLVLGLLSGCAQTPEPVPSVSLKQATESLCRSWRHLRVKPVDNLDDETASGVEASNRSRTHWGCVYGENRAKKR